MMLDNNMQAPLQDFTNRVVASLVFEETEKQLVIQTIASLFEKGFIESDAVVYLNHTEMVNPLIDESVALKILNKLNQKYP